MLELSFHSSSHSARRRTKGSWKKQKFDTAHWKLHATISRKGRATGELSTWHRTHSAVQLPCSIAWCSAQWGDSIQWWFSVHFRPMHAIGAFCLNAQVISATMHLGMPGQIDKMLLWCKCCWQLLKTALSQKIIFKVNSSDEPPANLPTVQMIVLLKVRQSGLCIDSIFPCRHAHSRKTPINHSFLLACVSFLLGNLRGMCILPSSPTCGVALVVLATLSFPSMTALYWHQREEKFRNLCGQLAVFQEPQFFRPCSKAALGCLCSETRYTQGFRLWHYVSCLWHFGKGIQVFMRRKLSSWMTLAFLIHHNNAFHDPAKMFHNQPAFSFHPVQVV